MERNYLTILGEKQKSQWPIEFGDNRLKLSFYFLSIRGNKKNDRKAEPSVRVGRKATGLCIPGVEPASGYYLIGLVL